MKRIPIKVREHVYNELPKGWVKFKSKSHPDRYWYLNEITGEKTWLKPLPKGWVKVKSKSRPGKHWYLQTRTGEKSTKRPNLRL